MNELQKAQQRLKEHAKLLEQKNDLDYKYRKNLITMVEYHQRWNVIAALINKNNGTIVYKLYE